MIKIATSIERGLQKNLIFQPVGIKDCKTSGLKDMRYRHER